ncbi:putative neutral ceramidase superfamily lipid hydrolase [Undibacterium sp. GrIS 1.8]|uniref:hypothetical protein n=1 Tax=unclassified Undibacterium TaxID=2630295 RepID=UPI00339335C4
MSLAFSFLPLLLMPCIFALLIKLAAFLYKRTQLRWTHALIYGVIVSVLSTITTILNNVTGRVLPVYFAFIIGLALQLLLGGWYLGPKATNTDNAPILFKGGVILSLISYLLVVVTGILAAIFILIFYQMH